MSEAVTRGMREQLNTGGLPLQGQGEVPVGGGVGAIWLAWSASGLRTLRWAEQGPLPDGPEPGEVPRHYVEPLTRYFDGKPVDPALIPVDLVGTEFQVRVYDALRNVARGTVRSYAGIAADVGSPRAMRAVGMANAKNPLPVVVPCHRIVETGNRLGGYSGGLERKVRLLELEGVAVHQDRVLPGQLDMGRGWID
jgi:methylated-DNA-[protein]-cysteine S-methyltransferase